MKKISIILFLLSFYIFSCGQVVVNEISFAYKNQLYSVNIKDEYEGFVEQKDLLNKRYQSRMFNVPFYIAPDYLNNRLVWDVFDGHIYGVTIINSKIQPFVGLKYITKTPLKELNNIKPINSNFLKYLPKQEYIFSASIPLFNISISNFQSKNYFFDISVSAEDSLLLFVQYDYQLHLSSYNGKTWTDIACYDTEFNDIFNAIQLNGKVYIIDNNGITYFLENDKLVKQKTKQLKNRAENVLVIDKDEQSLSYISKNNLQQKSGRQLKALIERNRVILPPNKN